MDFDPLDPSNELYARPRYLKVFISSKMAGDPLVEERRAAIQAAENFPLTEPWAWERDAVAGSFYSEAECVGQAGTSDAIVLIVEDDLTRVTKAEYVAAHREGAHAIILQKRNVTPTPGLARFIAAAHSDAITKEFSTLDELRSEIDQALWTWTVRAGRTVLLRSRKMRNRAGDRTLLEQAELIDDNGNSRTLGAVIEELEKNVTEGKVAEALDQLYELASTAIEEDHYSLGKILVNEIERIIPPEAIEELMRGWILNLKGRNSFDPQQAHGYFEQMRQVGVAIADENLEATAHQNLGALASIQGNHEDAKKHFKVSFDLKLEIGDDYAAAQLILNMVNVMFADNALDMAGQLLDSLEEPLKGAPGLADLRSTLFGQRGLLETKRGDPIRAKAEFSKSLSQGRRAKSATREAAAMQSLGANASERGDDREAIRWHSKALERAHSLGDRRKEITLLAAIATAHTRLDEWEAASKQFTAAADIADLLEDEEAQSEAWANVAACWIHLGKPEVALKLITGALGDPKANPDPAWRANQLTNLGEVLSQLNEPEAAIKRFEEAANLAAEPEQKDDALQRAAEIALVHPGLADSAPPLMERALNLQREIGTTADWAWRAATIGALFSDTSQIGASVAFFTKALRVFARNGDRRRAFYTRNDRAIARTRSGDLRGAAADLRAANSIATALADRRLQFQARMNLGEVERQRQQYAAANVELQAALQLARASHDVLDEGAVLALIGLLRDSEGRLDAGDEAYKEALSIGRTHRNPQLQSSALGGLGRSAYQRGRFADAERYYHRAIQQRGDTASALLAEDLAGRMMSQAARGRAVEEAVQNLIDVSGKVGWDNHCAERLSHGAQVLIEANGDPKDALTLQSASIMCVIRAGIDRGRETPEEEQEEFELLLRLIMEGVHWILRQGDSDALLEELGSTVNEGLEIPSSDSDFITDLISQAASVWREG